jgi:hypothetical protein
MSFLRLELGIKAPVIAIASLFPAAALAQQPAAPKAVQPSAAFLKTAEAIRSSICKNAGLLSCLQLDRAKCEAQIGPAINSCGAPVLTSQNEGLINGFLMGCTVSALLPANAQRSKEATDCIQRAGKK